MTTLYRSPNVSYASCQWHVTVEQHRGGKPRIYHRFRTAPNATWQPVRKYSGRLPVGLHEVFETFRKSIRTAVTGAGGVVERASGVSAYCRWKMTQRASQQQGAGQCVST